MSSIKEIRFSEVDLDKDGVITTEELFRFILNEIKTASKFKHFTGEQRHKYVLDVIKVYIGDELYNKHKEIISGSISFFVLLAKNRKLLNGISKICCC